jgi:hypothetical protein
MGAAMTDANDLRDGRDWLDELLRADAADHASDYIDDAGFVARVTSALPAAAPPLPAWRRPAVAALWGLAGAGAAMSFPDVAVDVGREAFRLLATQPITLPQIGAALAALGLATWAAAAYALKND